MGEIALLKDTLDTILPEQEKVVFEHMKIGEGKQIIRIVGCIVPDIEVFTDGRPVFQIVCKRAVFWKDFGEAACGPVLDIDASALMPARSDGMGETALN